MSLNVADTLFSSSKLSLNDLGVLTLRIGMGFVFLWAGYGKVTDPEGFGQMLTNMVLMP